MNRRLLIAYTAIVAIFFTAVLWIVLQQSTCPEGFVAVNGPRGVVCVSGVLPEVLPEVLP